MEWPKTFHELTGIKNPIVASSNLDLFISNINYYCMTKNIHHHIFIFVLIAFLHLFICLFLFCICLLVCLFVFSRINCIEFIFVYANARVSRLITRLHEFQIYNFHFASYYFLSSELNVTHFPCSL